MLLGGCDFFNEKVFRVLRGVFFRLFIVIGCWFELQFFVSMYKMKLYVVDFD